MVNKALIDYIRTYIDSYRPEQIRQALMSSGWSRHDIDQAFREVKSVPPPAPYTGPPAPRAHARHGSDDMPVLVLKPRIIVGILPKFFLTLIVLSVFFSWLVAPLILLAAAGIDPILVFASVGGAVIFLSIFLPYMNLRAREYRFFGDRAEFYEGFLNIQRKVVRFDRVTDISYSRSVWERLWGTGTILLNTAGSPFKEIRIAYVRGSEKVYNDVQDLVKGFSGRMGTEAYGAHRAGYR